MGYSTCCPRQPGLRGRWSLGDKRYFPDRRERLERCATVAT